MVSCGVDDRVGNFKKSGAGSGLKAHLVTRHEGRSDRRGLVVLESRLDLEVQTGRGAVVGQNRDRSDVADAHLRPVGPQHGCHVGAIRSAGNHGHLGGGTSLTIRDRVGKGHGLVDARMGGDPQEVAFDERNLNIGRLRRIHRGH